MYVVNTNHLSDPRVKELIKEGIIENKAQVQRYVNECETVIEYLNQKAGRNFRPSNGNNKLIRGRLAEGFTVQDLCDVVDRQVKLWRNDPKMAQYLRPATLFNSEKFAQYQGMIGCDTQEDDLEAWIREGERSDYIEGECYEQQRPQALY